MSHNMEEAPRRFLERVLGILREAPAGARIDAAGIVRAAEGELNLKNSESLTRAVDALVRGALGARAALPPPCSTADWLERLHASLSAADSRAAEILALRLAGWTDREIAERLGAGPRLVRRILGDVCSSL